MSKTRILSQRKLDPLKRIYRKTKLHRNSKQSGATGMLYMLIIMSLVIVKVASSAALYQNQTESTQTRSLLNYNQSEPQASDAVATTTTTTTTTTATSLESDNHSETEASMLAQTVQAAAQRSHIDEMRAKLQQQQQLQQQQYEQQLQQQQQHLHAITSETSYLLERGEDSTTQAHEQPIYGTWRTKARRPLPPTSLVAVAPSQSSPAAAAAAATSTALSLGIRQQQQQQQQYGAAIGDHAQQRMHQEPDTNYHFYERLPKRAATMTPVKSELHDQLPRPPQLSTRRPASVLVRRQYSETPGSLILRDDYKPKPFHYPFEGPLPEHFKKAVGNRPEVNNIQDILQKLQISGAHTSKVPPMLMMPTGLHIAGSYKNLKSSGIGNFFRGKRHKPHMQFTIPIPMPMPMQLLGGGYHQAPSASFFNALAHPHQRISLDQFYPYKPRTPNEVNLLAMQPSLSKKKKKKQKHKQHTANSNNVLLDQHGMVQPQFAADTYLPHLPPIIAINATRQSKMKRVPFKVNLDIYPVLPPTKDYKALPFTLDEAKLGLPSRPASVALRKPFPDYMQLGSHPSAVALAASQPIYGSFRFPTSSQAPIHLAHASNSHIAFPDQGNIKFSRPLSQQNQQQQQQQQNYYNYQQQPNYANLPQSYSQQGVTGPECVLPSSPGDSNKSNQIMVHLNVFPKQTKTPATASATPSYKESTNPFYSNFAQIHRHTISEEDENLSAIEPRQLQQQQQQQQKQQQQQYVANSTALQQQSKQQQQLQQHNRNQSISRIDNLELEPLIDFEHPIVAADQPDLPPPPQAAALVSHKMIGSNSLPQFERVESRNNNNNLRYSSNTNIDQIASEAQTASLFRFPVEDLIQFQVDDAM